MEPMTIPSLTERLFNLITATADQLCNAEGALLHLEDRLFAGNSAANNAKDGFPGDCSPPAPLGAAGNLVEQLEQQLGRAKRLSDIAHTLNARI